VRQRGRGAVGVCVAGVILYANQQLRQLRRANVGGCGIDNTETKSTMTTTATWQQHNNQHDNQEDNQKGGGIKLSCGKEEVDYMAWKWIHISLIFWMVVLWFLVQTQNCMSPSLKWFGTKHTCLMALCSLSTGHYIKIIIFT
jgi:hypothetical protein